MRTHLLLLILFVAARSSLAAEPDVGVLMQRAVLVDEDPQEIRRLVASGVDPNAPIGCGTFAPLDGAVGKQNPALVELLLSLGARPLERQMVTAAFSANHQAALQMVKLLRGAGVSVNAREYFPGLKGRFTTPIHQAVWRENIELVRYLLGERGILLDEPNVDGQTPMMIAVEKGNSESLEMLAIAAPR